MPVNEEFVLLWGKTLTELREQGRRAIYAEAMGISNGYITDIEIVAYIKTGESLLFREENIKVVEEVLHFLTLKNYKFVLEVFDEEKEKLKKLKKLFGEKLEIV